MGTDEAVVGVVQHEDGILLVGTSVDVQALAERFDALHHFSGNARGHVRAG